MARPCQCGSAITSARALSCSDACRRERRNLRNTAHALRRREAHEAKLAAEVVPGEEWRDVVGWETLYQCSSLGRVRSCSRGSAWARVLRPGSSGNGYNQVSLSRATADGHTVERRFIHRLIAAAFVANPGGAACVDHIDRVRTNNTAANLRWVSPSQNAINSARVDGARSITRRDVVRADGRHETVFDARFSREGVRYSRRFKTEAEALEYKREHVEEQADVDVAEAPEFERERVEEQADVDVAAFLAGLTLD